MSLPPWFYPNTFGHSTIATDNKTTDTSMATKHGHVKADMEINVTTIRFCFNESPLANFLCSRPVGSIDRTEET